MATKKSAPPRRKTAVASVVPATSTVAVATRNLINMAFVTAACATILMVLMLVKKF